MVSFLFADCFAFAIMRLTKSYRIILVLIFSFILFSQILEGQERLSQKIAPASNLKDLASYLIETDLCRDGCRLIGSWFMARGPVYMTNLDIKHELSPSSQSSPDRDLPLIVVKTQPITKVVLQQNPGFVCWAPPQGKNSALRLFLKKDMVSDPAARGFTACGD